jgi:hypothetical protein
MALLGMENSNNEGGSGGFSMGSSSDPSMAKSLGTFNVVNNSSVWGIIMNPVRAYATVIMHPTLQCNYTALYFLSCLSYHMNHTS